MANLQPHTQAILTTGVHTIIRGVSGQHIALWHARTGANHSLRSPCQDLPSLGQVRHVLTSLIFTTRIPTQTQTVTRAYENADT